MIFAQKINKIPKFYTIFARKMTPMESTFGPKQQNNRASILWQMMLSQKQRKTQQEL